MPPIEDCGGPEGTGPASGGAGRTGELPPGGKGEIDGAGVWLVGLGCGVATAGDPNWTLPLMLRSRGACVGADWNGVGAGMKALSRSADGEPVPGQPPVLPWRGANSWVDRGAKPRLPCTGVSEEPDANRFVGADGGVAAWLVAGAASVVRGILKSPPEPASFCSRPALARGPAGETVSDRAASAAPPTDPGVSPLFSGTTADAEAGGWGN